MALLPDQDKTVSAIYAKYEERRAASAPRTYLGGSEIGEECRRMLWYRFRRVRPATFPGRILRLFETGDMEEERIVRNLRAIGCTVHAVDPETGKQWEYKECNGHLQIHLDGAVLGLLEAPKTWHLLEAKTSNTRQFVHLAKHGCQESKPVHWAQIQLGMGLSGLTRAVYVVQNKDTDELYLERLKVDREASKALVRKANAIITSETGFDRIGRDPSFFKCRFCSMSDFCWGKEWPDVSCRTCAHSSPNDEGSWTCAHGYECVTCDEHIFLPSLIHWAEPIEGTPEWIRYRADGYEFVNCAAAGFPGAGVDHYSSHDLRA
jgi:hypothetical protein